MVTWWNWFTCDWLDVVAWPFSTVPLTFQRLTPNAFCMLNPRLNCQPLQSAGLASCVCVLLDFVTKRITVRSLFLAIFRFVNVLTANILEPSMKRVELITARVTEAQIHWTIMRWHLLTQIRHRAPAQEATIGDSISAVTISTAVRHHRF